MKRKFRSAIVVFVLIASLLITILSLYVAQATIQIDQNLFEVEQDRVDRLGKIILYSSKQEEKGYLSKELAQYRAHIKEDHEIMIAQLRRAERSVVKQCISFNIIILILLGLIWFDCQKNKHIF